MTDTIDIKLTQAAQARREHRPADALNLYGQAQTEARESANAVQLARALSGLGQIRRDADDKASALAHYTEAVDVLRAANEPMHLAHTLRHAGDIASQLGDFEMARTYIAEALTIYRNHPEVAPLELANTLRVSALNAERGALAAWQEAKTLYAVVDVQAGIDGAQYHVRHLSASLGGIS